MSYHIDHWLFKSIHCKGILQYLASISILPVCDIWPAFQMDQEKFQKTYGVDKMVLKSKKIVLHCLKGKRAFDAADKLALLGYDDVYVYKVCPCKQKPSLVLSNKPI